MINLILGEAVREIRKIKESGMNIAIVTDPPFNVGYHYKTYRDKMKQDEYYAMLAEITDGIPFVMVHYPESLYALSVKTGRIPEKVVSWVYNSNTAKQHRDIAFFGIKPDFSKASQPYKNPNDKRVRKLIEQGKSCKLYDWWNINQVKNVSKTKTEHPCQMPLEVMENIVKIIPDDLVIVDPFMGSGTTGVACKNLNRNFIGIEMDEEYYGISLNRLN